MTPHPAPVRDDEPDLPPWAGLARQIIETFDVRKANIVCDSPHRTWPNQLTGRIVIKKQRYHFTAMQCWRDKTDPTGWKGVVVFVKKKSRDGIPQCLMQLWNKAPLQCDIHAPELKEWMLDRLLCYGRTVEEIAVACELTAHERLEWQLDYRARLATLGES